MVRIAPGTPRLAASWASSVARYRPEHERTVEHQALEVLREFLASFPEPSQKRRSIRRWPRAWRAPSALNVP